MAVGAGKHQRCITFDASVDAELVTIAAILETSVGALVRDAVRANMGRLRTRATRARVVDQDAAEAA